MNIDKQIQNIFERVKLWLAALNGSKSDPRDFLRNYPVPLVFIASGVLLLLYVHVFTRVTDSPAPVTPGQASHQFDFGENAANYLLFLPENYAAKKDWPLIVYLHGASLRGNAIEQVKHYGLPKMLEQRSDFPFVVLSPQCPKQQGWRSQDWLMPLIDHIIKNYRVDEQRVYLTGMSLGGGGTWYWAAEHPEKFAAIAPLCGYGNPSSAEKLSDIPIWTFHGEDDRSVPIDVTEDMVFAIRKAGGSVKFTRFPDTGHNIVEQVYQDETLYEWLLNYRR